MPFTFTQQRRYTRHIMLPEIGEAGQEKLLCAKVLVIGAGGLGSALIPYLAAAGIGHLGIIDNDRVELSNLARQIIHETGDIGRLKVESAADRVSELNPDVRVRIYAQALTADNAHDIITCYDVIADGCDNFKTRFMVNEACVRLKKPLVSAAIAGWNGQVMSIAHGSACYACFLHPDAPEANSCTKSGVVGPLAGIIGSAQALEVVRMNLGIPALTGKLALFDGKTHTQRIVTVEKDPHCKICSSI